MNIPRYKGAGELEERTGKNAEDFLDIPYTPDEEGLDEEAEV